MKSNRTMGSIASELLIKTPDSTDPIEIQRATEKEYLDNLTWAIEHAIKKVDCSDEKDHGHCKDRNPFEGDFYIEALTKKEKLLENVLRNIFIPRKSCPTPYFDQTVYKYNRIKEEVSLLWVVPDQETCEIFRENKYIIVPRERDLLKNVLAYYDGTLFQMSKKLNGETVKSGVALEEK